MFCCYCQVEILFDKVTHLCYIYNMEKNIMSHSIVATKDTYVNVRVNEVVKRRAEKILRKLGVSMSDAINMLLNQININKGLPFALKIPNKETIKAIEEARRGEGVIVCKDADDMFRKLGL